jgi:hypothetical protein
MRSAKGLLRPLPGNTDEDHAFTDGESRPGKETPMTMNPNDPGYRRELQRETSEEGMSTAAWAGIAVAVMVIGGVAMYALSGTNPTSTASSGQPGIERSSPPATVGQGGAQSKMPATKEKAD